MAEPSSLKPEYQKPELLFNFEVVYLNHFYFRTSKGTEFSEGALNDLELKQVKQTQFCLSSALFSIV